MILQAITALFLKKTLLGATKALLRSLTTEEGYFISHSRSFPCFRAQLEPFQAQSALFVGFGSHTETL